MRVLFVFISLFCFRAFGATAERCDSSLFIKEVNHALDMYREYTEKPRDITLREKCEALFGEEMPRVFFRLLQCLKKDGYDESKAKIMLDFFVKTKSSASEVLTPFMSRLYTLSEDKVVELILRYPKVDAVSLTMLLEYSWDNEHYDVSTGKIKEQPPSLKALIKKMNLAPSNKGTFTPI